MKHIALKKQVVLLGSLMLLAIGLTACTQDKPMTGQAATQPVKMSAGQQVFLNHCLSCHMGAGDPPGPNEKITGSKKLASLESFKTYVRNPNNGMMPAFPPAQLSDADLSTLYDYVKSVKP